MVVVLRRKKLRRKATSDAMKALYKDPLYLKKRKVVNAKISQALSIHGLSSTPEYMAWASARDRCVNSKHPSFPNYGGRGIKMCKRWSNSFENFLADMGKKPTSKHSLDRLNNDGDYTPSNCRWATRWQQNNNKRDNRFLLYRGKLITVAQAAVMAGLNYVTLSARLRYGWSIKKALETPVMF